LTREVVLPCCDSLILVRLHWEVSREGVDERFIGDAFVRFVSESITKSQGKIGIIPGGKAEGKAPSRGFDRKGCVRRGKYHPWYILEGENQGKKNTMREESRGEAGVYVEC